MEKSRFMCNGREHRYRYVGRSEVLRSSGAIYLYDLTSLSIQAIESEAPADTY